MILVAVFVAVLGTSTYFIIDHYKEANKQAELYGELANLVNATVQTDAATEPTEQIPYSEEKTLLPELAELYQQNGDLVGWISIADTNINYPVMQSVNEPNFYHAGQFKYGSTTPTREMLISAYKLNNVSSNILNLTWNGVYGSGGLGRNSRVLDYQKVNDDSQHKRTELLKKVGQRSTIPSLWNKPASTTSE